MHSRDMEYIVGLLKNRQRCGSDTVGSSKIEYGVLARTTDLSGKLPVLALARRSRRMAMEYS